MSFLLIGRTNVGKSSIYNILTVFNSNIIHESLEIMKWALNHDDPDLWIFDTEKYQLEIISIYDNEFKYWLDRYKYYDRFPENNLNYYQNKCDTYLSKLNILLGNNSYILSDHMCFVDVAIFPFVRQFANVNKQYFISNYKNIYNWLNALIKSKLFLSVMHKYPEYNNEQEPLIINFNL